MFFYTQKYHSLKVPLERAYVSVSAGIFESKHEIEEPPQFNVGYKKIDHDYISPIIYYILYQ